MENANAPIAILMNAISGSKDNAAIRAGIDDGLKGCTRDVELIVAKRPRDLPALARQASDRGAAILAAAGGDGTLNAVATVARERGLPFAVIPVGTFNYFARDLGIPLDPAEAARLIVDGVVRSVTVGQVNGRLFLNNASIGLYRRLIEQREMHKRRFGRTRQVALLSALLTLWHSHPPYRLKMEIDGAPLTLSTLSVFFGRNVLQMEQLGLDEAACVARGEVAILALREVNRLDLMELIFRAAFARMETAENLRQFCALKVDVDWLDGRTRKIRTAIDGELVDLDLPLRIEAVPDGLQVIVPKSEDAPR